MMHGMPSPMNKEIKSVLILCTGLLTAATLFMAFESRGRFIESRFGVVTLSLLLVGALVLWTSRNNEPKQ